MQKQIHLSRQKVRIEEIRYPAGDDAVTTSISTNERWQLDAPYYTSVLEKAC
jgi:hypothetical protein